MDAQHLINMDRFPIFEEGENRAALVKQVQADLADDGCAVLKGFASKVGLASMLKEAEALPIKVINRRAVQTHISRKTIPVYLTTTLDGSSLIVPIALCLPIISHPKGHYAASTKTLSSPVSSKTAYKKMRSFHTPTPWQM